MKTDDSSSLTISVHDLNVYYGQNHVVRGVSFDADAGSVFGLLGSSGAGKSSVLAALNGVVPASGIIRQAGTDLSQIPARGRHMGHVYQEFRLFEWMSIRDNIAFPCKAMGWSKCETETEVAALMTRVGLLLLPDKAVRDLSGGERQRVALARALVFRPRALLLDEPFSHLDPPLREELKQDLLRMLQGRLIPVILVTHDYREAFELCDRIGIMIGGVLVQQGVPSDLLLSPDTLTVARLLGFSNGAEGTVIGSAEGSVEFRIDGLQSAWRGRTGQPIRIGTRVSIACRPERVRVIGSSEQAINTFEARAISAHAFDETKTTVITAGEIWQWTATASGSTGISVGDTVTCSIHPDDLMVYEIADS